MSLKERSLGNHNANQMMIRELIKVIVKGNSTAINQALAAKICSLATNDEDARTMMGCFIDTLDMHANHPFPVYKILFLIEACLQQDNVQSFYVVARQFAPDIRLVTMLTFKDQTCQLRKQIHQMAFSIYNYLVHGKDIASQEYEIAVFQTYTKPLVAPESKKPVVKKENKINKIIDQLDWEENSSSDEENGIWGKAINNDSGNQVNAPGSPNTTGPDDTNQHRTVFDPFWLKNPNDQPDVRDAPTQFTITPSESPPSQSRQQMARNPSFELFQNFQKSTPSVNSNNAIPTINSSNVSQPPNSAALGIPPYQQPSLQAQPREIANPYAQPEQKAARKSHRSSLRKQQGLSNQQESNIPVGNSKINSQTGFELFDKTIQMSQVKTNPPQSSNPPPKVSVYNPFLPNSQQNATTMQQQNIQQSPQDITFNQYASQNIQQPNQLSSSYDQFSIQQQPQNATTYDPFAPQQQPQISNAYDPYAPQASSVPQKQDIYDPFSIQAASPPVNSQPFVDLYNMPQQQQNDMFSFAPAQQTNSQGGLMDPFGLGSVQQQTNVTSADPFGLAPQQQQTNVASADPFGLAPQQQQTNVASADPFGLVPQQQQANVASADPFGLAPQQQQANAASADPFGLGPAQQPNASSVNPFIAPGSPNTVSGDPFGISVSQPQADLFDPFGSSPQEIAEPNEATLGLKADEVAINDLLDPFAQPSLSMSNQGVSDPFNIGVQPDFSQAPQNQNIPPFNLPPNVGIFDDVKIPPNFFANLSLKIDASRPQCPAK